MGKSSYNWEKVVKNGKNTEGGIKLNINKKTVFTTTKNKKNCYDDDKKNKNKIKK